MKKTEKGPLVAAVNIDRDALQDVPESHTEQQCRQETADAETPVPQPSPSRGIHLAAELHGDRARDKRHKKEHQGKIETAEHRRVHGRKCRKERPAGGEKPDFVAVPHRTDGIETHATVFFLPVEQIQNADAEIESIEDCITDDQHADEDEPGDLKCLHYTVTSFA